MKVLQINAVYGVGSTGYLTEELHTTLKNQGIDSYVLWATKCAHAENDDHVKRIGNWFDHKLHALLHRIFFDQGWHSKHATRAACRQIKAWGIDVIHLHNLHSNYIHLPILLRFCAQENIAVIPILHDCWFFTGQCFHFYKQNQCMNWKSGCHDCPLAKNAYQRKRVETLYAEKKALFSAIQTVCVTGGTQWIHTCGKESLLSCVPDHRQINDWIDVDVFTPKSDRAQIIEKYGIPKDHKIILGVSQGWSLAKGIDALQAIGNAVKDYATVILVGGHDGLTSGNGIHYVGYTANRQELVDLYAAADLVVNASRMETFGLVTVEALASGTPVVAYANTGTTELIPKPCGWVVEDGNIPAMVETVEMALRSDLSAMRKDCREWAVKQFDRKERIAEYIQLYEELTRRNREK